ncbi:MAG: hypothetical protein ACLQNE_09025 [Thermoguttaceae bacterium]
MDLVVFENNKPYILDEFRQGRFDYVELASDVAETKFFQFLFSQEVVNKLAAHYPTPRHRHHVPLWMYLSSQLSLGLRSKHQQLFIKAVAQKIDVRTGRQKPIGMNRLEAEWEKTRTFHQILHRGGTCRPCVQGSLHQPSDEPWVVNRQM